MKLLASILGAALLTGAAPSSWASPVECQGVASPPPGSDVRFTEVPAFSFTERSGATVTLGDLAGAPWIAVPFYARCLGPCPSLTGDLRARVYERLAGSDVRLVSFSVDPRFDSPEVLQEWAERFQVEDDRWLFLTGELSDMEAFVRDGLKVALARDETLEPGLAVTHSTRLPVVDPEGRIAGWYECAADGLGRAELEANMDLMTNVALALSTAPQAGGPPASSLPAINAGLNGLATILLVLGYRAIRRGDRDRHAALMKTAFATSAAFLACYVYYHTAVLPLQGGPTKFHGTGAAKVGYLVLLGTHVVLAAVNLPMILRTLLLARREDWERHRRWARWTFPIWLYVSVTGVVVYVVLYHLNPAP